jgi:Mlc titration factor MtfA (ptsG expression regulator)
VTEDAYRGYARAALRAAFLFDRDVTDYLETLRHAMNRHVAMRDGLRSEIDAIRARAADAEAEAFTVITGFYEKFDALIVPYMAMHQKLPE